MTIWRQLSREDRAEAGIIAAPSAALLLLVIRYGGPVTPVAWPALAALAVLALAVTAAAWTPARERSRYRTVRYTGGDRAAAARHEAGHLRAMQQAGFRNLSARIYPDGSGYTRGLAPPDLPAQEDMAIDYAGGYAEGGRHLLSSHACSTDMAYARATRKRVPWSGRGRVERDAHRLARHWTRTGLGRYQRPLERTGRYR